MDATLAQWVFGGIASLFLAIFVLWLNYLNGKIESHDKELEQHMNYINSANQRNSDLRYETSQLYVSKIDLGELKKQIESMASDIKTILKESRK